MMNAGSEQHEAICGATIRRSVSIPLLGGNVVARLHTFDGLSDGGEHIALLLGDPAGACPLVRVHSECLTGDVFGSQRCDCGLQLREAIFRLHREGGVLLYLRQEGRGIGLYAKIDAYHLQEHGLDTYAANRALNFSDDARDYSCASEMLLALGIHKIRLLSNNPRKEEQIASHGINVVERIPTGVYVNEHNKNYLMTKKVITGHEILFDSRSAIV